MEDHLSNAVGLWVGFAALLFTCASLWKIFVKAGEPGWASLVPIYNTLVVLRIAGRPTWWIGLMLIPLVNIVIMCRVTDALAKAFGGGALTTLGLLLVGWPVLIVLGYGDAEYRGAPA